MSRGDKRERDRAKNQAKQQAKAASKSKASLASTIDRILNMVHSSYMCLYVSSGTLNEMNSNGNKWIQMNSNKFTNSQPTSTSILYSTPNRPETYRTGMHPINQRSKPKSHERPNRNKKKKQLPLWPPPRSWGRREPVSKRSMRVWMICWVLVWTSPRKRNRGSLVWGMHRIVSCRIVNLVLYCTVLYYACQRVSVEERGDVACRSLGCAGMCMHSTSHWFTIVSVSVWVQYKCIWPV